MQPLARTLGRRLLRTVWIISRLAFVSSQRQPRAPRVLMSALGAPLGAPAELPAPCSPPVPPQRPAGAKTAGTKASPRSLLRLGDSDGCEPSPSPNTPRNMRGKLASLRSERGDPRKASSAPQPQGIIPASAVASPFYLPPGSVGPEGPSALCRAGEVRSLFCSTHAFGCSAAAVHGRLRGTAAAAPGAGRCGAAAREALEPRGPSPVAGGSAAGGFEPHRGRGSASKGERRTGERETRGRTAREGAPARLPVLTFAELEPRTRRTAASRPGGDAPGPAGPGRAAAGEPPAGSGRRGALREAAGRPAPSRLPPRGPAHLPSSLSSTIVPGAGGGRRRSGWLGSSGAAPGWAAELGRRALPRDERWERPERRAGAARRPA